jgi:hypothetical protein
MPGHRARRANLEPKASQDLRERRASRERKASPANKARRETQGLQDPRDPPVHLAHQQCPRSRRHPNRHLCLNLGSPRLSSLLMFSLIPFDVSFKEESGIPSVCGPGSSTFHSCFPHEETRPPGHALLLQAEDDAELIRSRRGRSRPAFAVSLRCGGIRMERSAASPASCARSRTKTAGGGRSRGTSRSTRHIDKPAKPTRLNVRHSRAVHHGHERSEFGRTQASRRPNQR